MKQNLQLGTLLTLIIMALALVVFAIAKLFALFILILIAIVITTGIDPLVHRLQHGKKMHLPRATATLLVLLLAMLIVFGAIAFLAHAAVVEAINIYNNKKLQGELYHEVVYISHHYGFIPRPDVIAHRLETQSGRLGEYLWSTTVAFFGFLGTVFSVVLAFILTFFFTTFQEGITYTLSQFIPPKYQARVREVSHMIALKMGGWLRGQLTLAFIITAIVTAGMAAIGFPAYAFLVGIIGGLGELIPMVGPYLAFLPALLIALFLGHLWQVIAVIAFFIILAQIEGYVLAPKIMQSRVGLHPITTILALLIGGSLLGIVGALLAIPLAAGGRVFMLEVVFPAIQHKSPMEIAEGQPDTKALETAMKEARENHPDEG